VVSDALVSVAVVSDALVSGDTVSSAFVSCAVVPLSPAPLPEAVVSGAVVLGTVVMTGVVSLPPRISAHAVNVATKHSSASKAAENLAKIWGLFAFLLQSFVVIIWFPF
jgi:hypothetical protein